MPDSPTFSGYFPSFQPLSVNFCPKLAITPYSSINCGEICEGCESKKRKIAVVCVRAYAWAEPINTPSRFLSKTLSSVEKRWCETALKSSHVFPKISNVSPKISDVFPKNSDISSDFSDLFGRLATLTSRERWYLLYSNQGMHCRALG